MAQLKDLLVTGPVRLLSDVVLGHDPTAALHAATKQYVDASAGKLTVGALTSGTTYYPILATGTGTATRQIDSSLPGFTYIKTNGTTGAEGTAVLSLGNTTASGTANNASGRLALYDYSGKKATVLPRAVTSHTVDTALYLPDWGTSTSTYLVATTTTNAVGSSTVPVYVDAKGIIQQGSTYAGGTRIVLNDTDRAGGYVSFYAPGDSGTAGQVLESAGYQKAPSWRSFMSYLYTIDYDTELNEVWNIDANYRALWDHLFTEKGLNLTVVTVQNGFIEDAGWTIDSLLQDAADTSHVLIALDPTNNFILTLDSYSSSNDYKSCTFSTIRNNIQYSWLVEWDSSSMATQGSSLTTFMGSPAATLTTAIESTLKPKATVYPKRLVFTSTDGQTLVPINTSSSSSPTSTKTITTTPIDPFGPIYYYDGTNSTSTYYALRGNVLYLTATFDLRYSFYNSSIPGSDKPIYLKCAYNSSGQCVINSSTPFVYTLPTTADSALYILIGYHGTVGEDILIANHPVYRYSAALGRVVPAALTSENFTLSSSTLNIKI